MTKLEIEVGNNAAYLKDVVHPCVRYTNKEFHGHHWWMVYTPYFGCDEKLENPILCYADEDINGNPSMWIIYKEVRQHQGKGYNSDPSLFIENDSLFVLWRECFTKRVLENNASFSIYGCLLDEHENSFHYFDKPIISSKYHYHDSCLSPNIIKENGQFKVYGVDFKLRSKFSIVNILFRNKLFLYVNALLSKIGWRVYRKHIGVSSWVSDSLLGSYIFDGNYEIVNGNKRYQYWHLDCFEKDRETFFVIQSNEVFPDILLGRKVGRKIILYDTPLMSSMDGYKQLYKPSMVQKGGDFFLFYTVLEGEYHQLYYKKINCKL